MEKETVGNRIKRLRKQKKISVTDIADKIGVSRSNFYRYESDEIEKMPYTTLVPIAKILGVTPSYLLTGKEEPTNNFCELVDSFKASMGDVILTNLEIAQITTFAQYLIAQRKK